MRTASAMNAVTRLALALALVLPGVRAAAAEVENALASLRSSQRADGSWPAACGLEVEATATAVRAFAGAGEASGQAVARALAFLAALPEPVPNHHLALRALARLDAGRDARPDLDRLFAGVRLGYDPPAGWGLAPGDPAETIATALALEALSSHPDYANRAELLFPFWCLRRACARFPVLFTADPASRDGHSSLHVSAFGIVAFHLQRARYPAVESMTFAVAAARERQDATGGYGDTEPTALETALVLHATKTARVLLGEHETLAADFLRARQAADGSWGGDALATAWAVRALSIPVDTDGDQMPDAWEAAHGLDLQDRRDAASDVDGDGLAALVEFRARTDPLLADSDGDGFDDGAESRSGSNPLDPASRNRPPAFVSTPVTFAALGAAYRYAARAVDPDGDAVTYSLLHGPGGLTVDASSGAVTWAGAAAGVFPVGIAALDGRGGRSAQSYVSRPAPRASTSSRRSSTCAGSPRTRSRSPRWAR